MIETKPNIVLNKVVFPPPLGPTTPTKVPFLIEKLTSSKITSFPSSTQQPSETIWQLSLEVFCNIICNYTRIHNI